MNMKILSVHKFHITHYGHFNYYTSFIKLSLYK
jgi:hypothetical protein